MRERVLHVHSADWTFPTSGLSGQLLWLRTAGQLPLTPDLLVTDELMTQLGEYTLFRTKMGCSLLCRLTSLLRTGCCL